MPSPPVLSPICLILVLAGLSGAAIIRDPDTIDRTYDYIVAGGGLTGLVVANRLTEDPNLSVLVVEYGDFDDSWDVAIPYFARFLHTQDLFELPSVPQKGLGNRTFNVYLGRTVGGGSTVNGMALSRGSRTDYDSWEALGNPGWGWEAMFEYFKKSSTLTYPTSKLAGMYEYVASPEGYGQGPMQAGFPKWQFPALYDFIDAWTKDIGVQYRTDGDTNGENLGMAWKPIDIDPVNITRSSARKAYYDPVSARPNLDILVGNYVATLVTEPGASVRGVNVARVNSTSNEYKHFASGKDVILAAGAVHTTQILQMSGIGLAALLEPLGINVIADLPGVGANFQDHPTNVGFAFQLLSEPSLNPNLYSDASFFNASWDEYMANRTGPLTWAFGNNRVVLSLENLTSAYGDLIDDFLDVNDNDSSRYLDDWYKQNPVLESGYKRQHQILSRMIAEQHGSVIENVFGGSAGGAFTIIKPLSRGTVLVNSTNPDPILGAPLVDYQALTHPLDMKIAIAGVRMARRLLSTPSLAPLRPVETVPGANVTTDEQIEHAIRTTLYRPANAHPCCTAAMMPKELGGVVDPHLRVYGVTGLRIVDASILPLIPSAHTQETMYAVAEKAADVIKGVGGN